MGEGSPQRAAGNAESGDLPCLERPVQRLQGLFQRRQGVELVKVIKVDAVDLQAAQRLIEVMGDLGAAQRPFALRTAVGVADLGGDLDPGPKVRSLVFQPGAQHGLADAATIGVGGVEAREPKRPRLIQQCQGAFPAVALVAQGRR